ncbi:MAG: phosphoenolpyruvate--protein phosphotransferase [Candidatus Cloacimonadota bacterium]|nr:MAG: phosphoenolpyruvate--protein phosphotransferase [Candidatus Cloacimonadota bacterium]
MKIFKGIPVTTGIAIGKTLVIHTYDTGTDAEQKNISVDEMEFHINKFKDAKKNSLIELESLIEQLDRYMMAEELSILYAHREMINDPVFDEKVIKSIKHDYMSAEFAVKKYFAELLERFEYIESEYLLERKEDLKDIQNRVLGNISGKKASLIDRIQNDSIIVAENISPSFAVQLAMKKIKGFVTTKGGATSHTSVFARAFNIPAVVGIQNLNLSSGDAADIKDGLPIIVDGDKGIVIIEPDKITLKKYQDAYIKKEKSALNELKKLRHLPTITIDGKRIKLFGNIELPDEVEDVITSGAEGIGLFRTEFLYLSDFKQIGHTAEPPTEDKQFEIYTNVIKHFSANQPVIIRTIDIGGDKSILNIGIADEPNPYLGCRAIRLSLLYPEMFKIQLRAILRASVFGKVKIMLPLISSLEEVEQSKKILEECKKELDSRNVKYDHNIKLGIMMEVPSAALMAEDLAKQVDFFSIGTNDLTQYVLAVDRNNERIAQLFDSYHPAVINLIEQIAKAGKKYRIPVALCGEMAADLQAVPLLIGLGIDELSMSSVSIPSVKKLIRSIRYNHTKEIVKKVKEMKNGKDIKQYLENVVNSTLLR